MRYEGPLYGKVGNKTFDTGKTGANWDAMEAALKLAKDCIEVNRRHIESMGRHAVEGTSATLDEISNALMPNAEMSDGGHVTHELERTAAPAVRSTDWLGRNNERTKCKHTKNE